MAQKSNVKSYKGPGGTSPMPRYSSHTGLGPERPGLKVNKPSLGKQGRGSKA